MSIIDTIEFSISSPPIKFPDKHAQNAFVSINANIIASICVTVFIFPHFDAAITFPPFSIATNLYPETINSLASTIIAIHDGILFISTNKISADITKILSANGSKNLPNVVI